MAQSFVTDSGELVIPGAYASYTVQPAQGGLATTGVIALIGEADSGPDYSAETDLSANAFGPDQRADVIAKYKSGRLVDAFVQAISASNDARIVGSPSSVVLVKTNVGSQASVNLVKADATTYAALAAKSYGKLGNLIYEAVTAATSETLPTTGKVTFIPNAGTVDCNFRVSGAAVVAPAQFAANTTPTAFVSAIDALAGVACTGGAARSVIDASFETTSNLALTATGNSVVVTLSGNKTAWITTPSVGDTLTIPSTSVIKGGTSKNIGAYVVTAATATTITATKESDAGAAGPTPGTVTTPETIGAQAIVATTEIAVYAPITITLETGNVVDGVGKTLEINELTTGTDLLSRCILTTAGAAVTFISKSATAAVINSATEYSATLSVNRQSDSVSETITSGGTVVMLIGYKGTTATLTITKTDITTTVVGGSGGNLALKVADYPTVADLVKFIATQTGYTAASVTTSLGQTLTTSLDRSTFNIGSTFGANTGRIKKDAFDFFTQVSNNSAVVQVGTGTKPARVDAGVPAVQTTAYLAGGAVGSTSDAIFTAALTALEKVACNFVVPLVSRDSGADVTDGLTDASSAYTIASVNAAVKTHCTSMSTLKRRKARQGFLSFKGAFSDAKDAAGTQASARVSVAFEDVTTLSASGTLTQFQPWMAAVTAAGMQAAGFYRAIVNKAANITAATQVAADWSYDSDTDLENALNAGLLPIRKSVAGGGFRWVSDQTSYSKDNNFVFNSIQAVYVADTIALSCAARMENRFAGESLADVSAAGALSYLEGIMSDFLRLKLIAPSDDAPRGFKNVVIKIAGPVMTVSFEVKLAGALYFIPITFLVSQVTQAATG